MRRAPPGMIIDLALYQPAVIVGAVGLVVIALSALIGPVRFVVRAVSQSPAPRS
jgi:hypothetical protein